jgi:hypothetical protein
MRRDRRTGHIYPTFWAWLQDGHILFIFSLLLGYWYYLITTDQI